MAIIRVGMPGLMQHINRRRNAYLEQTHMMHLMALTYAGGQFVGAVTDPSPR
jgi:hypothetical protein